MEYTGFRYAVLIESDWNLKWHSGDPCGQCRIGINRIRLEFKASVIYTVVLVAVVLIESDWNLKVQI